MKRIIFKILALLLSPIIVLSSTSFVVEEHICEGEVVSISYLGHTDSCNMDKKECLGDSCSILPDECPIPEFNKPSQSKISISELPCCVDDKTILNGISINSPQSESIHISKIQTNFIVAFVFSLKNNFRIQEITSSYFHYFSPHLLRNISVLFQVFII